MSPTLRPSTAGALLVLLAACTSNPPTAPTARAAGTPTSGPASGPASTGPSVAAIDEVVAEVLAPRVVSTDAEEYRISLTPDGATAYFGRGDGFFPQTRQATIMETTLVDGEWSAPVVAAFSGEYSDIDPWVSPDGQSVYFSSIRPTDGSSRADAELFRVDRDGEGWGEPVHLAELGSDGDELGPSASADGMLWFASDRAGGSGGWDLYTAQPTAEGFAEPEPVATLNSAVWEFNPAIDAAGSQLLFTSINRQGGSGLGDLYVAVRDGDEWSQVGPLAVNSPADEYHPSLAPDGRTLYFVRRTAQGDIHQAAWPLVDPGG